MSELTGADLGQLDDLAAAFTTAGNEIAAKGEALRTRIQASIDAFNASLTSLQSTTQALTEQTNAEMQALRDQGASVGWTGNNRTAFDGDLAAFGNAVNTGTAQINTDIAAIKSQVDSSFTPVMVDFASALKAGADDVNAATADMKTAVDTQRTNLDQAANVGWTNA